MAECEGAGSEHPLITRAPSPPPGRLQAAFIPPLPSRLLAFPPLSPSTRGSCRRRRTLCCGALGGAEAGPGGLAAGSRRAAGPRALAPPLSRAWAPGAHPPRSAPARRRQGSRALGGGTAGGGCSPSPAPPLPRCFLSSLPAAPPRRSSDSPPDSSRFPFASLLETREVGEATRWRRRGWPSRPACKVVL